MNFAKVKRDLNGKRVFVQTVFQNKIQRTVNGVADVQSHQLYVKSDCGETMPKYSYSDSGINPMITAWETVLFPSKKDIIILNDKCLKLITDRNHTEEITQYAIICILD